MKSKTRAIPSCMDKIPASILSAPRLGPTVLSSTKRIGAAKAPALSNRANSEDSLGLSKPVILKVVPSAARIVARLIISFPSNVSRTGILSPLSSSSYFVLVFCSTNKTPRRLPMFPLVALCILPPPCPSRVILT